MEILELKNITEMKLNKHAQRRVEGTEEQISEPEDREREFIQPEQLSPKTIATEATSCNY